MITIERNKIQGTKGKSYFFLYDQFNSDFHKNIDRNGLHTCGWDFWIEFAGKYEFIAIADNGKETKKYELTKNEIKKLLKENAELEQWVKLNKSPY